MERNSRPSTNNADPALEPDEDSLRLKVCGQRSVPTLPRCSTELSAAAAHAALVRSVGHVVEHNTRIFIDADRL